MGRELKTEEICNLFKRQYIQPSSPLALNDFEITKNKSSDKDNNREIYAVLGQDGKQITIKGQGNGPISSFVNAIYQRFGILFEVENYSEHSLGSGSSSKAATYVQLTYVNSSNEKVSKWGCGIHNDVSQASIEAILSVLNSLIESKELSL